MNKLALVAGLHAFAAGPVFAASIGIYADQTALSCEISDPLLGGVKTFYVVHTNEAGSTGSAWQLTWDPGMTMTWLLDDTTPFTKVGNARDGIHVSYTTCQTGTFKIDTITMLSLGTSTPCSHFRLGPDPTLGRVIFACDLTPVAFTPGDAIVNANGTCSCSVASDQTTWGKVKGMYR